jgi:hypothetical protein
MVKLAVTIKRNVKKILGSESRYRGQLEDWLSNLDIVCERVLDVGGGLKPVKGRTNRFSVSDYRILDNGLEKGVRPDFEFDLNTDIRKRGNAYRSILKFSPQSLFCLEVMEYVYDPVSVLGFFHTVLSRGGTAHISFPAIYPVHEPVANDCLRYTRKGIETLLGQAGFKRWHITARIATAGKRHLEAFFREERMKAADTDAVYDIGYLVTAHKT